MSSAPQYESRVINADRLAVLYCIKLYIPALFLSAETQAFYSYIRSFKAIYKNHLQAKADKGHYPLQLCRSCDDLPGG